MNQLSQGKTILFIIWMCVNIIIGAFPFILLIKDARTQYTGPESDRRFFVHVAYAFIFIFYLLISGMIVVNA